MSGVSGMGIIICDEKELLSQLKTMNMKDICVDTHSMSMNDIMLKMSQAKERHAVMLAESKHERASTPKSPKLKCRSPERLSPIASNNNTNMSRPSTTSALLKQDFSIARFRPKTPVWEKCLHPDPQIEKLLYRTPCFDCTGKNMSSLGRDEAKGVIWVPPEVDRNIPPVSIDSCSTTFRKHLAKHVDKTAHAIAEEYERMPSRTERERNQKARAGADLFNLQQVRDKVVEEEKRTGSPTRSRSASPLHKV